MAKEKKLIDENLNEEEFDEEFGDVVIEMTDEDGNSYFYTEEMIIPVGDDKYALLVEVTEHDHEHCDHEHKHEHEGCDCGCEDGDVIIAKIVQDENGEDIYVEPTDEEFELVQKAYEELIDEDFDDDDLKN